MVTRLITSRPAPWLHAAAIGAFVSLTIVLCRDAPHWAWVMAPLAFAWSRLIGWLLLRALFRHERSPVVGRIEIEQARLTLHGTIHNFVDGLTVMQGEVDVMILRAERLKLLLNTIAEPKP